MISSDVIRGYNDTFILFFLLDGPSYGYEISKHIREQSDGKYIIKETTPPSQGLRKTVILNPFPGMRQTESAVPTTALRKPAGVIMRKSAKSGK